MLLILTSTKRSVFDKAIIITGWNSTKMVPSIEINDNMAITLLARDWKGFANYGSNGVVKIEKHN